MPLAATVDSLSFVHAVARLGWHAHSLPTGADVLVSLVGPLSRSDDLFFVQRGSVWVVDCLSLVVGVGGALGHAKIQIQVHVHVDGEEVVPVSVCCLGVALRLEW